MREGGANGKCVLRNKEFLKEKRKGAERFSAVELLGARYGYAEAVRSCWCA
jgi:hypothetical protein